MLLLLVLAFISNVAGLLRPGDAHFALALAPVLVAGSGLHPRRRAGTFAKLTLAFLADVHAAALGIKTSLILLHGPREGIQSDRRSSRSWDQTRRQ
eukprot:4635091-Pyramimonas_sp.AAC.1